MDKTVICIAGAHRSGTSLLTRLLQECGLFLGPDTEMMPAGADNLDGFWENLRFVELNEEILNAVGAAWDLPPLETESYGSERTQPVRAKAQLLLERFASQPRWGWKDPRNSLTLTFWRDLLPDLRTVIMVRNPLEVAYSMHKRNGTSYALGLRLWEIYNRRALANSNPGARLITNYQAFFDDPENELRKIVNFAGLSESAVTAAAQLVSVNRRHTSFTIEQMIDAGVSQEVVTLYQLLLLGETAQPASSDPHKLGLNRLAGAESRIQAGVTNAEDARRELATRRGDEIRYREEIARHQTTIDNLRNELTKGSVHAAAEISRRDGQIEELRKASAHLDALLAREQTAHADLIAREQTARAELIAREQASQQEFFGERTKLTNANNQLASERDGLSSELSSVRDRFNQTNQLLQTLSVRTADLDQQNRSLTDRLRKHLLEFKKVLRILDQVEDAAGRLRHSRRWKLANPFTALLAVLRGKEVHGFGHLDKNVAKYRSWRLSHPEMESLNEEIQLLRSYGMPIPAELPPDKASLQPVTPASDQRPKPSPPTTTVEFATYDQVEISIIIPVFNQLDYTLACLSSIQLNSGEIPYEVIIVDDDSSDATPEVMGQILGVNYLRQDANSGFIAACNRGAKAARGRFLLFLNNDTTVTSGWLAALRDTFDLEPNAGLVGSKLVYPDGRLQEAGGIIWKDGSGWNRGKFGDPGHPEYNYLKEVDYCSAASLMIRKDLFEVLGGFDSKYAPAYYEDTDLAFKVAAQGKLVLYQPLSVVVHYEGITGGTDLSSGAKKYQELNRTAFISTWAETLSRKPANGDVEALEQAKPDTRRILVIDHHLPMHDRDSGSLRMFQILKILHRLGHQVTFLPDNLADIPPYGDDLRKHGIEVVHHPYTSNIADYLQRDGAKFDVIILSRCDFARKHVAQVREFAPQSRLIFDTVDLHYLRTNREAELTHDPAIGEQAREKEAEEFKLIDEADETWVVSTVEQELLTQARPAKTIHVVSNIVEVPGSALPFSSRQDFLFIGSFQHTPNIDAVLFFAKEVYPLVRDQLPSARFFIIGDKAPPNIIALASEQVIVTGLVPDARPYFDNVKLSIAPLRYGAGVKGKINQSMGLGVPVVASSIAVEGMGLTDREDVVIADEPAAFARGLFELYTNEELWNRISLRGVQKTEAAFSRATAERQLRWLFSDDKSREASTAKPRSPTVKSLAPV